MRIVAAALALVLTHSLLAADSYELVVAGYEMPCGPLAPPPWPAFESHPSGEIQEGVFAIAAAPGRRLVGLTNDAVVEIEHGTVARTIYTFERRHTGEALVVDRAGRIYVHGGDALYAIDADGTLRAKYPLVGNYGDGIGSAVLDLAADQCTLYLLKDERTVQRFDVCRGVVGETFAVLPPPGDRPPPGSLSVLPDGGLLIGRGPELFRYSSDGRHAATYHYPRAASIEAVGLAGGGQRAWLAAGECVFHMVELDLTSGNVISSRRTELELPHTVVAADVWTAAINGAARGRRRAVAVD